MSTQMTSEAVSGEPPDMVAAVQRMRQLQTLIAQAQQTGSASATSSFAAELAAAAAGAPVATGLEDATGALTATASTTGSVAAPAATELTAGSAAEPVVTASTTGSVAAPVTAGSEGSQAYDSLIDRAADRYGIDPALLYGLIQQESGFDPSARSSAGALGLTQLMPQTAASLGVTEPLDPAQSIEGGARYLSQMLAQFGGNTEDAVAAYNAGPGAVSEYGGVPPYAETQSYVKNVLANASAYAQTSSDVAATPPALSYEQTPIDVAATGGTA